MNDFLTEKNKKAGILGKTENGFFVASVYFFPWEPLGHRRSILVRDDGEWQQQRFILWPVVSVSDFQGNSESIEKKKAGEIAIWFESYAQNTVSFEKLEQEMGKGAVKNLKNLLPGDISEISR